MKKYRLLIIIIVLVILGFLFAPQAVLKPTKNALFVVTRPFSIAGAVVVDKISMFFRNLTHLASLSHENQNLMQENLDLQGQIAILKEAQHENEILKKEMGFLSSKGDLKLIPANIVGRSLTGYLRTITIDRGLKDNIKAGQGVLSQGYLVGTLKDTMENNSEVTLVTNYNSLVPVLLQDSRGTGLLRGGLKGLTVEDIPLNIIILSGEQVVTSGLGGDIPAGIPVGKVNEIISKEGEIFQKVTVSSPIQIYYLEFVFVAG